MLNNKKNMKFDITENNAEDFAVIPTRDLENIMRLANAINNQTYALIEIMRATGFETFAMQNTVKTLADMPIFKRPGDESGD